MAAIDMTTQVPAGIDTVEKAMVWMGYLSEYLFRGKEIKLIDPSESVPRVSKSSFTNSDGEVVHQFQFNVVISDAAFNTTTGKIWDYANSISDISIPADFTT